MPEKVIDISRRLERLNNTVQAARVVKQNLRATDWQRVQREHPDHAAFISAVSASIGKPKRVQVKTDAGDVILDSRRYE
jgi:hypothetical protein